jgi:hypothetical protein
MALPMTKTLSKWKIEEMRDVFECLCKPDHQKEKKELGIHLSDYGFAKDICNALLAKMERETERAKQNARASSARSKNYSEQKEEDN